MRDKIKQAVDYLNKRQPKRISINMDTGLMCIILIYLIGFLFGVFAMLFISNNKQKKKLSPAECGYTKILYGKGIDCNGDTINIKEYSQSRDEYLKYLEQQTK